MRSDVQCLSYSPHLMIALGGQISDLAGDFEGFATVSFASPNFSPALLLTVSAVLPTIFFAWCGACSIPIISKFQG